MRNFITFIFMIVLIYLYAYIFVGEMGIWLLYMCILSPLISLILTWIAIKKLYISFDVPEGEAEKDETLQVSVIIKNQSFIPIPVIDIVFASESNFILNSSPNTQITLGGFKSQVITLQYMTKIRGNASLGIENITIKDYLGLFRFSLLKNINQSIYKKSLNILPRLLYNDSYSKNEHKNALESSSGGGEFPSSMYSFTIEPGYEVREFMEGDPLHKIHWKLSAKKNKLMVRKDQYIANDIRCFIVDPCILKSVGNDKDLLEESTLILEENVLEAMLSAVWGSVKQEREVKVGLFEDTRWIVDSIKDKEDVKNLQRKLASYTFVNPNEATSIERIPISHMSGQSKEGVSLRGCRMTVFTGPNDKEILEVISSYSQNKIIIDLVSVEG